MVSTTIRTHKVMIKLYNKTIREVFAAKKYLKTKEAEVIAFADVLRTHGKYE